MEEVPGAGYSSSWFDGKKAPWNDAGVVAWEAAAFVGEKDRTAAGSCEVVEDLHKAGTEREVPNRELAASPWVV